MKFIIKWDAGFGINYDEIEAKNKNEAQACAYELWKEEAECNAIYGIIGESTEELKEEYL